MANWDAPSLVLVIGAIFGGLVLVINAWFTASTSRSSKRAEIAAARSVEVSEQTDKKTDALMVKATEIHTKAAEISTQTNGQLHSVTAALAVANEKIAGLESMLATVVQQKRDAAEGSGQ